MNPGVEPAAAAAIPAESRAAFLVQIDEAIRPLADAKETTWTAARLLGEHLGVNRCAYADVEGDEDTFNLTGDYNRDVPSIVGRYRFLHFGGECLRLMRAGRPYVVEDAEGDPRTSEVRESYRATLIRAVICVPLRRGGRLVAAMAVHHLVPREWRADEVELVQLVADRCWESIERARAQTEVLRQWHTFDVALSHTPDFIYIFDLDGRFTYVNNALLRLWQKPLHEAVGRNFVELGYPQPLAARLQEQIQQVIATRNPVRDQTPFTGPTGETRHYEYIFVPVLTADGHVQGVTGSTRDITDRMRSEEDLRCANEQLKRTNRELEQYAYVASHDLQEPLRMVSQFVSLLDRRARPQLDQAARGYLDRALDGAQRMQTLIRDLLSYAQLDRKCAPTAVELDRVLALQLEQLKPRLADAGATIVADRLPTITGIELQVGQILLNLLGNALKFRSPERPAVIQVAASRGADGWWTITVRDNGIGIPLAQHQRIFDVFQRLHQRDEYEGTGIGLAICKNIVEHHGGAIWVAPSDGPGTTFCFTLPGEQVERPSAPIQPAQAQEDAGR